MGNSGSVPNITSKQRFTYEELDSYYQQQQLHTNRTHQYQPIQLTDAYLHESYPPSQHSSRHSPQLPVSQPHIKVLPDFNPDGARLRATHNGNILNSGGTISGRKEPQANSPKQFVKRNEPVLQHQRSYDSRIQSNSNRISPYQDRNQSPREKNYDSYGEMNGSPQSAKALLKNKKKKFAPPPPLSEYRIEQRNEMRPDHRHDSRNNFRHDPRNDQYHDARAKLHVESVLPPPKSMLLTDPISSRDVTNNQRKLRLFKTKAETKKFVNPVNQNKNINEQPELPFQRNSNELKQNFNRNALSYLNSNKIVRQEERIQEKTKLFPSNPTAMFRREKSFDISLLSNHRKEIELEMQKKIMDREMGYKMHPPKDSERKLSSNDSESSIPPVQLRRKSIDYDRPSPVRKSVVEAKINLKKISQPQYSLKNSFKKELEEATKRRRNSSSAIDMIAHASKEIETVGTNLNQTRPKSMDPTKFVSSGLQPLSKSNRLSPPIENDPKSNRLNRTSSKIPQLNKTFYFGNPPDKSQTPSPINSLTERLSDTIPILDSNKLKTLTQYAKPSNECNSDSSSETDGIQYKIDPNSLPIDCDDDENINGIQLNVRPILPRRQLEIPRFSPSAAWRMLNEEQKELLALRPNKSLSDNNETRPIEERIQRIFREPQPLYPDNKSGDSGISGDAGLLEGGVGPGVTSCEPNRNLRVPWIPKQDLDDDETSSSEDEVQKRYIGVGGDDEDDGNDDTSRGHVFSLSLPRENHVPPFNEKEKLAFSSLQKLKRTVSGAFSGGSNSNSPPLNDFNNGMNYRSDNWLLSRSQPNSIDNSQISSGNKPHINHGHTSLLMTSSLDENNEISSKIQHSSLNHVTQGRHMMYLPNRLKDKNNNANGNKKTESNTKTSIERKADNKSKKCQENKKLRESLQDVIPENNMIQKTSSSKRNLSSNTKNHRFTFQSTVRQLERRRISERLSKEAEEKEAQRKSELEAMSRVEEEFQRKRAREKATICHQLRLFSMEENQCSSLPVVAEFDSKNTSNNLKKTYNTANNSKYHRAEPDGQSPRSSPSFVLKDGENSNYYYEPEFEEEDVRNFNKKGYLNNARCNIRKQNSMEYKKENFIVPIIREKQNHKIRNLSDSD